MKSSEKIFFSLLFIVFISNNSIYSQIIKKKIAPDSTRLRSLAATDGGFLPTLPSVGTPSPQSEALTRYGDYPVGYNTGIVDMTIPLYEIKSRSLKLPITMGFHASGRMANEINGILGMRWTLNCGGLVTRTMNGRPDDMDALTPFIVNPNQAPTFEDLRGSCTDGYRSGDLDHSTKYDSEFDVFKYVLPSGKQGKFILKNVNGVRQAMTIPYEALKIEIVQDHAYFGYISSIKIWDTDGTIYYFGGEGLSSFPNNVEFAIDNPYDGMNGSIPSAWYLKKIISADLTDTIDLEYTQKQISYYNTMQVITTGDRIRDFSTAANFHPNDITGAALMDMLEMMPAEERFDLNEKRIGVPVLSSINYQGGSVSFQLITDPALLYNANLLKEIDISGAYTRKIRFHTLMATNEKDLDYLKSVEILSQSNGIDKVEQRYQFEYYEPVFSDDVTTIGYSTERKDWWGYYRKSYQGADLIPQQEILYQRPMSGNTIGQYKTIGFNASREPNVESEKLGMLKSIEYPTEGKTEFDYEGNIYDDNGSFQAGPGLRIKEIKTVPNTGVVSYKTFKYGVNENGTGYIAESMRKRRNLTHEYGMMFWWDYASFVDPESGTIIAAGNEQCGYRIRDYSSDPIFNYSEFGDAYLSYTNVSEYEGNELEKLQKNSYEYSLKNFQTNEFIHDYDIYPVETPKIYVNPENIWTGGKLLSKINYKKNIITGLYEKVSEEGFAYTRVDKDFAWDMPTYRHIITIYDRSYEPNMTSQLLYNQWYDKERDYNNSISPVFGYGFRKYTSGVEILNASIKKTYNSGGDVTVTKNYVYEPDHLFLKSEETVNSNGKSQLLEYIYPSDPLYINGAPYHKMVEFNMLANPIKQSLKSENTILKSKRTSYKEWGDHILLPENEYYSFNNNPEELRIEFQGYDNKGNIKSMSKSDGPKISYIYSYNGAYPIAQIENVEYSTVESLLGGAAAVQAFRDNPAPTDADVISFLAPLHGSGLTGAMVTTYTYKPLVGMTTQTDPKGMTTTYEYDNFQRLKAVKDHDGKIVKSYDYHYKP